VRRVLKTVAVDPSLYATFGGKRRVMRGNGDGGGRRKRNKSKCPVAGAKNPVGCYIFNGGRITTKKKGRRKKRILLLRKGK